MSTRQQRWAAGAHKCIQSRTTAQSSFQKKYRSLARELPSLIQQSGLIQALIFIQSREQGSEKYGEAVLQDLAQVYDQDPERLIRLVQEAEMPEYLRYSEELIALSIWFRRYATVLLKEE